MERKGLPYPAHKGLEAMTAPNHVYKGYWTAPSFQSAVAARSKFMFHNHGLQWPVAGKRLDNY
jgi:hypothetical protein